MTADPFKVAADLARTLGKLKPVSRPAWQRAVELNRELNRELAALRLPDDEFVDEPTSRPSLQMAGAGVTSTGSVPERDGFKT